MPVSDLLSLYRARGFLQDATPGLAARLAKGPIVGYVGFDPTADSLHVGSLVPVMGLAWLQRAGGTPIALVGAGTAMVGDPSGKRQERPVLTAEEIDANAAAMQKQLAQFLRFGGTPDDPDESNNFARMRNNAEWLRSINLMEFFRDTGKHFTLSYMLQKESVRSRMETGISYTEFSYMLVQAYDFWHLFTEEQCELQMGGSDQWGNITAGIELIARRESGEAHGVVFPLITTASGAKFGKSEGDNVWLDPARTSPYRFYQFWLNTEDADVERYLKLFTFLELDEIAAAMAAQQADPSGRAAQRLLARAATAIVHGEAAAERARLDSEALFGRDSGDAADHALQVIAASSDIPVVTVPRDEFDGLPLVDLLCRAQLASSKADARRGLQAGGYYVNGEQIGDPTRRLGIDDLAGRGWVLLRKGKKNYVKVVLN